LSPHNGWAATAEPWNVPWPGSPAADNYTDATNAKPITSSPARCRLDRGRPVLRHLAGDAKALSRWGRILLPVVLIGIGLFILIEGDAFGL
jgi:hypothetical protein